jgi:hypothetical protein
LHNARQVWDLAFFEKFENWKIQKIGNKKSKLIFFCSTFLKVQIN